ncbi:cytochrome b/b6 domain-containing protein [Komarekiella sp. 'clone 1']|uniref:Cytochrome b/b6 domain-containing protein n=1 Tax=Komarekiella delphini-convector SJRDD-AB1 TaxID=2593771 RepID=A0AA40SVR6_9NOST|nr:cytochrome b/b6 domain-containing protein [Komarekiella delphini-convector]MBD6616181.1 cytochrome b/b6 domain-containing protein [Komarekiella delphini-convector SJRDD-AB1]
MTSFKGKGRSTPSQTFFAKTFHWINIISLLLMITSGLQIYNANPVFGGREGWRFPNSLLLGGWLAGGRHWHFAAMWLFSLNLLGYGLYILITRRWRRRFGDRSDLKALQVSQNPKRKNYAWHRLVYTGIIPVLLLAILSGLAMYKPAQLYWLSGLFGSWQTLRIVHFITVPTVIVFTVAHSWLALKVGSFRLIKSMFL